MIAISKAEKEAICTQFPNTHIVRTMKQKSKRHHYYCEESKQVMRILFEMRYGEKGENTNGHRVSRRKRNNRK